MTFCFFFSTVHRMAFCGDGFLEVMVAGFFCVLAVLLSLIA